MHPSLLQSLFKKLLVVAACLAACTAGRAASSAAGELIPRTLLFGNPTRTSPNLSPDGARLAFLAPRDGVLNVWVAPVGHLDQARPLTAEKERPIQFFSWMWNNEDIVYVQDRGGDEDFLLYAVNAATADVRLLTDFKKTRVRIFGASPLRPDELVVGINNRDPRWHDAWLLNVRTGDLELLRENQDRLSSFLVDDRLELRLATRSTADGGSEILTIGDGGALSVLETIGFEDDATTSVLGLTGDGATLYLGDSRGRDKAVLEAIDLASHEAKILAADDRADVGGVIADPVTGRVLGVSVDYLENEWRAVDPSIEPDLRFLAANVKGQWELQSQTRDNRRWVLTIDAVTEPVAFYLYDRDARSLQKLFTARPDLEGRTLAPMHAVEIKARDGLTLVSYLTLPADADPDGDGRPAQPLPLLLWVHGGPWARDNYGYNSVHQWLANRGYAVLSVNYRGSTGFGKNFIAASDKEWAGRMHDDLLDAVAWAIAEKIAPADKIAIGGGSYGGYATLVGVTFTPDVFACGVDIVGPSNLATLLSTIPPYWEAAVEQFARRVGDWRTEEGRKFLAGRSPLFKADAIKRPLLIGQGANDPRVKQAEADQIVAAMKQKNLPVTYVLYPDEGHGFARPENRLSFFAIMEGFLAHCLGGRYEPVGGDFKGSSLQVLDGATQVPGLPEALPQKPAP